jgi:hypothetical protein
VPVPRAVSRVATAHARHLGVAGRRSQVAAGRSATQPAPHYPHCCPHHSPHTHTPPARRQWPVVLSLSLSWRGPSVSRSTYTALLAPRPCIPQPASVNPLSSSELWHRVHRVHRTRAFHQSCLPRRLQHQICSAVPSSLLLLAVPSALLFLRWRPRSADPRRRKPTVCAPHSSPIFLHVPSMCPPSKACTMRTGCPKHPGTTYTVAQQPQQLYPPSRRANMALPPCRPCLQWQIVLQLVTGRSSTPLKTTRLSLFSGFLHFTAFSSALLVLDPEFHR